MRYGRRRAIARTAGRGRRAASASRRDGPRRRRSVRRPSGRDLGRLRCRPSTDRRGRPAIDRRPHAVELDLRLADRQPGDPLAHERPAVVVVRHDLAVGRRDARAVDPERSPGRRADEPVAQTAAGPSAVDLGSGDDRRVPVARSAGVGEDVGPDRLQRSRPGAAATTSGRAGGRPGRTGRGSRHDVVVDPDRPFWHPSSAERYHDSS